MKAFVITRGCYSDYQIVGVYSSRDKAKKIIDNFMLSDEPGIKEWDMDEYISYANKGIKFMFSKIHHNGNISNVYECGYLNDSRHSYIGEWIICEMFAKDKEQMIKHLSHLRTQILSVDKWGDKKYLKLLTEKL